MDADRRAGVNEVVQNVKNFSQIGTPTRAGGASFNCRAPMVGKVRADLPPTYNDYKSDKRTGADGWQSAHRIGGDF